MRDMTLLFVWFAEGTNEKAALETIGYFPPSSVVSGWNVETYSFRPLTEKLAFYHCI